MEVETEGGGKVVGFRVKAASRELATQKAVNVLEADLRSHWSTATNTKEWILLELHEPCLLSHIRIYNKSVLEWEIAAGLRYKPEAFVKVRPRCEAPKRDMMYPTNYTPCRYVRISCLRGNPIAIFFIQLIGVPVPGLEPELQPVVNYLLPHITSHKQDSHNMHLQLIQDMASRLPPFLTQIEADLTSVTETPESTLRFLAMLAGPFYPILQLINERDVTKTLVNSADSDALKNSQASTPTISSNFEAQPRRSRSPSFVHPASCMLAFRSETAILLLRKAHKEKTLGIVCRRASKVLQKLLEPALNTYEPTSNSSNQVYDEIAKSAASSLALPVDYSSLFGEEFSISENHFDDTFLNILDIAAVEEGILHVLYAAASQPLLCCKLAEITSDMSSVLPLIQALLPALRPPPNPGHIEQIDDSFCQWNHPTVRNALSQIVTMSVSSSVFHPLLRACAGYLSSYLPSHARAACILVDLCRGPLSPWIPTITVKVDLAIELLEDLLGVIQGASQSISRSRSALKYVILAISGHMDDVLPEYKEVKHNLLFLLEMLDPFVDPSLSVMKDTIAFGGVNAVFLEKQQRICSIALNIIRTAVKRPAVLPSLELEWQRGAVAPSVLLSVLDPHMPLPPEVDFCKSSATKIDQASFAVSNTPTAHSCNRENFDGKDSSETTVRAESFEECNSLFAPEELKQSELMRTSTLAGNNQDNISAEVSQNIHEGRKCNDKFSAGLLQLDDIVAADCYNAQADYLQLVNHQDCELRALEFERLALDLCMQQNTTTEGHNAGIDALLLAAECYVNPFFLMAFRPNSKPLDQFDHIHPELIQGHGTNALKKGFHGENLDLATIYNLENKRDMAVLDLLLRAAKFDREYQEKIAEGKPYPNDIEDDKQSIEISPEAIQFVDAVTLVRKNQAMLCHFVMKQFQREGHLSNEILLQSLLFLLHSATDLFCPPENVIDIILHSAENLNGQLTYLYNQVNERGNKLDTEKLHMVQRRWALLQKLVLASSGSDNGREPVSIKRDGFRFRSLVPPSAWMQKIPEFSRFSSPLPRFLGWMAVSRYAKEYLNERLFLASDFLQLTSLLSIFMDELALMDGGVTHKVKSAKIEPCDSKNYLHVKKETAISDRPDSKCVFQVMLPDLHFFFPSMSKLFRSFGETILGAVGLQLKCFPNSAVQDVLCWFSEMCLWPYLETIKEHLVVANSISCLRGNIAANAKAVVFYLLESVVAEHLEAIVPEMPRLVHILVSLCRASYTDVAFLESVLCLVKPLISYFLRKRTNDERLLSDITECNDFDLLGFDELFEIIQCGKQANDTTRGKIQIPLLIFTLGSLFPDLPFTKKVELFDSLLMWIDFINSDPPSSLCSYIQGFQMFIDGCEIVLVQNMELLGIDILAARGQCTESASSLSVDGSTQLEKQLSYNAEQVLIKSGEYHYNGENCKGVDSLPIGCIKEFCDGLERFISHLIPSIEASWKWHHLLASKLSLSVAKCLLFAKCLEAITQEGTTGGGVLQDVALKVSGECAQKHWGSALEDLAGIILISQENQCWQVASAMLDYMLKLPDILAQGDVLSSICSAIKHFCFHAPRVSWRLQTEKWLSLLVSERLRINDISLVDLFCKMLSHAEPEQRSVALQQLGRTVSLTSNIEVDSGPCTDSQNLAGSSLADTSILVTQTWDRVAALVLYDPSMLLRRHAMALLTEFVPFVDRNHLRSFLASSNIILNGVGKLSNTIEEGHLTRMSLMLLCRVCLYSPSEDISLIPECVWRKLEDMRISITGGVGDMEKDLCRALCQLRTESDAKTAVKEISLSGSTAKPIDPCFKSIRESILQVLSSLSTVESYFEFFSIRSAQEAQELEEAEIELELIEKERAVQDFVGHPPEAPFPNILSNNKDGNEAYKRLQQIREDIRSLERSRLREEIIARRQKKLLIRHTREKFLEEASSREMELLQNLDRERALETEREIERQRQLDLERVRTRELQFNLDMEREKQNQRELQRELEQIELGRSSRREFSGNANSRSRERYRERDNGRVQQEGSLRSSSRGNDGGTAQVLTPGPNMSSTPTVVLAGSRSFSGNLPTILQSRERSDERGASYEDNAEGSRDSGDASSIGDPELGSAFDGLGLVTRHGPRGSKSRQVVERREREGRREGKWERKHS